MPLLSCLVCGRLSNQSRCKLHRSRQARGYTDEHFAERAYRIGKSPVCENCGHTALHKGGRCNDSTCKKCPLQLDHSPSLDYIRKHPGTLITYRVLCRECNRAKGSSIN